ncbi:Tol biopolymer transport system component [Sphingopyxis sp. OAS728]|uniref:TolB family protein n=1 Tax=Sphingopyxis sp. OAS728 TaxID=2663823 RepID=UPI00178A85EA|nr:PD40 domain-containing protein [Sphingopyxis sp. OAS728]MBE1528944.1 Tol biopolymer transport system component [Sphingopyxis sp. OAS728]
MNKVHFIPVVALVLAGAACSAMRDPPEMPVRWTPDSISSPGYEATPTFSPDGRSMLFLSASKSFTDWRIMEARCMDGQWSAPYSPEFAASPPVIEADPGIAPDGEGLYFLSARHDPKGEDFDIYFARRVGDEWGDPVRLPAPVNSPEAELLPRVDGEGTLYFGSSRAGGYGDGDIYIARRDGRGRWQVANAGPPISTAANEYEAEISRDGRTMVVVADRGSRSHLYLFRRPKEAWIEAGRIPSRDDVFQVGPLLSPRSEKLLFAQAEPDRSGEIFLIDLVPDSHEAWPPQC